MQLKNKVTLAAAGSGKTTDIVRTAIETKEKIFLITTFTAYNLTEIRNKFFSEIGYVPKNVKIKSWFSFLLSDCVRPYQNYFYSDERVENILFVTGKSAPRIKKSNTKHYYLAKGNKIFTDKISEFALECNNKSNNLVIARLERIYDVICIDEIQDLAGYDLELLKLFFNAKLEILLVGDNRQATYSTNNSSKNKNQKGKNIIDFFKEMEKEKICNIEYKQNSHRCKQCICDLADYLYPDMPETTSCNAKMTEHDGIFIVNNSKVEEYIKKYSPQILRYNKSSKVEFGSPINFGLCKGSTYDRVLIIPTGPIKNFLKTGNLKEIEKSIEKLYVAITRAKYSVAFLCDEKIDEKLKEKFEIKIY